MNKRYALALLLLITLLAVALRSWRLAETPPGFWWDEARDDWVALNVIEGGPTPVYFTTPVGTEPMHIYLTALWFRLFGVHYLAPRWVSALVGALAIPLLYWAAVEWLSDELGKRRARTVGLLAAATLAALFAHMLISRIGFEIIIAPTGTALTMSALGRGQRLRRARWFVLAGLALGLTLYGGPTSRAAPLIVVAWGTLLLALDRPTLRALWPCLALLVAAAVIVYAPLGLYYLRHPEWFFGRMQYVTSGSRSGWQTLLDGSWRTALGLVVRGEAYPRHNLPERPFLDPIQACSFLLGLALVFWRKAKSSLLIPLWLAVSLLPSAVADGAPSFTRGLGAALPASLLVALGAEHLWQWGRQRWGRLWPSAVLLLALLTSTALSARDLFIRYPQHPDMFDAYEIGLWEALQQAKQASQHGPTYLSPVNGDIFHPTVDFVLRTTPQIRHYDGRVCQVFSQHPTQDLSFVLLLIQDRQSLPRLQAIFPNSVITRQVFHKPDPYPVTAVLKVPAGAQASIEATPTHVHFGQTLDLIAYNYQIIEQTLDLTLYWRSLAPVSANYTVFVHAQVGEELVGQADGWPCAGSYPTTRWRPGEVVIDQRQIPLSALAGAQNLRIHVGLYDLATLQRLPISAADVPYSDDRAHLITIRQR